MTGRDALASLFDPSRRAPPRTILALCALLVAINPLTWALHRVNVGLFPDSIAYLAFGRGLLEHGRLFLAGWGHVDSGLILAPAYPALLALWGRVTGDPIMAAYAVSSAALLLATLPLALAAVRLSAPGFALAALAVAQVHPFFLQYGTAALSEALFVLVLAGALLMALALPLATRAWPSLLLGAAAGASFLVRPIGGFLFPAMLVVVACAALGGPRPARRRMAAGIALATLGFAATAGPYALALHAQSGQWPVVQAFRMQQYVVTSPALAPEEGARAAPGAAATDPYEAVYAERRTGRRLTDDAAEMVGALLPAGAHPAALPWLPGVVRFPQNLASNLRLLAGSIGMPALVLLALSLLTSLWRAGASRQRCWTLPIVITSYFAVLSLLSGLVPRYAEVMAPLAYVQVLAEAHRLLSAVIADRSRTPWLAGTAALLALVLAWSMPATFRSLRLEPRLGERGNPLEACREAVEPAAPIFAFHPLGPYLLGATWRAVPNDVFDKVRAYAARTGVHELLVTQLPADAEEIRYYDGAPWLHDLRGLVSNGSLTPVCRTGDGMAVLFRLAPPP